MKPLKWLSFSCPHCPLHDPEAVEWLLGQIRDEKPDVIVHLGDGHEADAASRFKSEYEFSLTDEFQAHKELLKNIRLAAPKKARLVMLAGNHEANLLDWDRIDKKLRDRCDYRKDEAEELQYWEGPVPYLNDRIRGTFRLGQVVFAHGFSSTPDAGDLEAPYFANEYGLYIHGHTHAPTDGVKQCHRTRARPLRYWYANPGTMRLLKPHYVHRKRTDGWGQGIVIGESRVTRSPRRSKCWDAEVRVFRMYDEWSEKQVNGIST